MIININNPPLHAVEISRQGENEFREIVIDISSWLAEYPDGKISVIYCRPDGELYPVIVNSTESPITWRPTATDTAVSGVGAIEVRIQIGDVLGKSCTIAAKVLGSLGAPGDTPAAPAPDWAQTVTEDADRAEAAAEKAEAASTHVPQISASKTWLVWDANKGEYVDTGVSAAGEIPEVDDTLTQPGQAADAAAVGDRLSALSEEISTVPENVALLEDVTADEASGDFIPMLSPNGTEYRLSIGDNGVPVIKNANGATVWSGTSGGSSGGGSDTPTGEWQSGAEVAYTLVDGEWANDDGSFVPYDGYSRTDFIYCYGAGHIYHSCSGNSGINIIFYDIAKKCVSSQGGYAAWNAIPENAAYVVMSFVTESMTGSVIKLYKKVEPTWTDGEPYEFTFIENEYVNVSSGEFVAYSGWKRTDYVNCAGATKIAKTNASAASTYGVFYNAEKERIIGMITPDTTGGTSADITVPVGACYFVTSDSNANMDALVLIPYA